MRVAKAGERVRVTGTRSARRATERRARGLRSDRDSPQREPALELLLDGQLGADLGLQAQFGLVITLLRARRRHERIERAPLVVVDPVQRQLALILEREHGAQHALAVAAGLQRAADGVDPDDEIVELLTAQD